MKRSMYAIPSVGLALSGCGAVDAEPPTCGDGVVEVGVEDCDDGNLIDNDTCSNACTNAVCGDGRVFNQAGGNEDCDDGNNVDGDACTNDCVEATCGDGIVFDKAGGTEQCDDSNAIETDGCLSTCELDPVLRAFEIATVRGVALTDVQTYQFCSGGFSGYGNCYRYTACSRVFDSPLTMSMALVAQGSYTRTRDCAEDPADNVITKALSGTVQILTTRQQYRISLMEDATAVELDCAMEPVTVKLTCTDDAGKSWLLDPAL
jgi:cysteine-rich repeat protein